MECHRIADLQKIDKFCVRLVLPYGDLFGQSPCIYDSNQAIMVSSLRRLQLYKDLNSMILLS